MDPGDGWRWKRREYPTARECRQKSLGKPGETLAPPTDDRAPLQRPVRPTAVGVPSPADLLVDEVEDCAGGDQTQAILVERSSMPQST